MISRTKVAVLVSLLVAGLAAAPLAAQQMFPSNPDSKGLSAYLIAPSSGAAELPKGWTKDVSAGAANCMLAYESLSPAADAQTLTTVSYELPKADYEVALCCLGRGKARLKGAAEWTEVTNVKAPDQPASYYRWSRLGTAKEATRIEVEVAPAGDANFHYAGLVAEGAALAVIPASGVLAKLRQGVPVTICLVGDSVTEDAKGFRGGSSRFETGNPGLLKRYLEEEFKTEASYISHREPRGWPDDAGLTIAKDAEGKEVYQLDESKVKMTELGGKKYRDGRVEFDAAKKIRLVNMGKGGAASNNGWARFAETFSGNGDWRLSERRWVDTGTPPSIPPILRNGLAHYKPDLVVINFGTNDANGAHKGWKTADFLFHTKVLATMAQKNFQSAVIVTTPHLWTQGTHQQPHTQPEFADAIRRYARETGLALADIYNEYQPGEYDGIHPGDPGHKHIADAIMKALLGRPSEPQIRASVTAAQLRDNGDGTVTDTVHNLMWTKDANLRGGKATSTQAAAFVLEMNQTKKFGHDDWRLPTREELLNLLDVTNRPALPKGHPFANLARYYITTTLGQGRNWFVDFSYGVTYYPANMEALTGWVWPVRDAK